MYTLKCSLCCLDLGSGFFVYLMNFESQSVGCASRRKASDKTFCNPFMQ